MTNICFTGQIYALVLTFINRNRRLEDTKMVLAEPAMIMQPKPTRKIAVTPNYMEDTSESDLRSILSAQSPPSQVKLEMGEMKETSALPPPAIDTSKGSRQI